MKQKQTHLENEPMVASEEEWGEELLRGKQPGDGETRDREREVTVIQERSRVPPCFAQIGCTKVSMIQRLM